MYMDMHMCHISGHNFRPTEAPFSPMGRKFMPSGHITQAALAARIESAKICVR